MIGTIDIKVNAAHPNIALDELHAFLDSPSSVRVLNVPRKIGSWQITSVRLVVEYPDNEVHSVECRLVGGVYVGTIAGSTRTGKCVNGFSVVADGVDENGDVVDGYVLGVGDVVISDRSVTAEPEERM